MRGQIFKVPARSPNLGGWSESGLLECPLWVGSGLGPWLSASGTLLFNGQMTKSQWLLAFAAYTVILFIAVGLDTFTAMPRWQVGLAAVLSIAAVGWLLSDKRKK